MSAPYGIGGYSGPSERLPRDAGGVEMQAPEGVPFNRQRDEREAHTALASADDPATRRQLPWIAFGLMLTIFFIAFIVAPLPSILFAGGFLVIGGLVAWLRSMD